MSTEIQPDVTDKPEVTDKLEITGKPQGLRSRINPLLFAAMVAAVIAAWQWYEARSQIESLQQEFEKRLVEIDVSYKELRNISTKVREKREETETRIKLLETNLTESINRQAALEELYQDLAPDRDEVTMEEVEQLLLIANQQLQLASNVKSALIAMHEADVRLQRINHPQLSTLRKTLAKDMDLLKAVPNVDTMEINLRLESLAKTVDTLPLAMEIRPSKSNAVSSVTWLPEGVWSKFLLSVWNDIKQLVRIQNMGERDIPLLSPSQSYFLRENLKLRLLSTQHSLLARDAVSFKTNLKTSMDLINQYYDNKSAPATSMLEILHQLHDSEIGIELPNISASYDEVRKYRLARIQAK
ncbi:MAG: uroporphyrinogen-III synthase [Betaproteobacteria bacterium]|nr:MAG: uroporphyrinogen-III synthase [Betaproteobacteria bacterium]